MMYLSIWTFNRSKFTSWWNSVCALLTTPWSSSLTCLTKTKSSRSLLMSLSRAMTYQKPWIVQGSILSRSQSTLRQMMRSRKVSGRALTFSRYHSVPNLTSKSLHRLLSCLTWRIHLSVSSLTSVLSRSLVNWLPNRNGGSTTQTNSSQACRYSSRTKSCG